MARLAVGEPAGAVVVRAVADDHAGVVDVVGLFELPEGAGRGIDRIEPCVKVDKREVWLPQQCWPAEGPPDDVALVANSLAYIVESGARTEVVHHAAAAGDSVIAERVRRIAADLMFRAAEIWPEALMS